MVVHLYFTFLLAFASYAGLSLMISCIDPSFDQLPGESQCEVLKMLQRVWGFGALILGFVLAIAQVIFGLLAKKESKKYEEKIALMEETIEDIKRELNSCKGQIGTLQLENEKLSILRQNIAAVFENYLVNILNSLDCGEDERITLYVVNPEETAFNISKRCSSNPTYRFWKQNEYSMSIGCIGRAWTNGWYYKSGFPNYEENRRRYKKAAKELGYSAAQVEAFTMKACTYFAYRFSSLDKQDHKAIVVLESMNPNYKSEEELKREFRRCNDFVYRLVRDFYDYIPRGPIAEKEGL